MKKYAQFGPLFASKLQTTMAETSASSGACVLYLPNIFHPQRISEGKYSKVPNKRGDGKI